MDEKAKPEKRQKKITKGVEKLLKNSRRRRNNRADQ
jgi:hypothetical protein